LEEIVFHYQTEDSFRDEGVYTAWIKKVLEMHGKSAGMLSFVFVSDDELLELNRDYLNHDYYTDIITFEYTEFPGVSGDLFISADRVKENAVNNQVTFEEEVRRVMIHGVLHLLGYKDKTAGESREMRAQEDRALELFHVKH
jgi:rRNA maturation RNase YbeY